MATDHRSNRPYLIIVALLEDDSSCSADDIADGDRLLPRSTCGHRVKPVNTEGHLENLLRLVNRADLYVGALFFVGESALPRYPLYFRICGERVNIVPEVLMCRVVRGPLYFVVRVETPYLRL